MKTCFFLATLCALSSTIHADEKNTWARYECYADQNASLTKQAEIVIMGDSITEGWPEAQPELFAEPHLLCRGIGGQTTEQMLTRFQSDVIKLHPKRVIILAGTNDVAQNNGYISDASIIDNIASMCELALFHQIQPVICSILPVREYPWNKKLGNVSQQIITINKGLKIYAEKQGIPYVDAHTKMKNEHDALPSQYSYDGVHLTKDGYLLLEKIMCDYIKKSQFTSQSGQG